MQNTWYIPWYISKKTVIYHIPTTGQNAMWYTMWYATCDIPRYITPFVNIYHGIYHVIWRFGIYHSMVYTSWYKVYINMVYINLECYIPCYITLSLLVDWLSWHLWYITGPRVASGAYDHSVIFISAIGTICAESQQHWVEFRRWTRLDYVLPAHSDLFAALLDGLPGLDADEIAAMIRDLPVPNAVKVPGLTVDEAIAVWCSMQYIMVYTMLCNIRYISCYIPWYIP